MANEEHLAILRQGVEAWNAWRMKNLGVLPDLSQADLEGANLSRADLRGVNLMRADLFTADLSEANLSGSELEGANLSEANLRGAKLIGVDLSGIDLSQADLSRADLYKANLIAAILIKANLSSAELIGANLSGADLSETDLSKAGLGSADLSEAILAGANLYQADLYKTNLSAAKLHMANLSEAHTHLTVFVNTDLSSVVGLDKVQHTGPSSVGIDTLYYSGGKIPESFLRGCGVPESWLEYLPSLLGAMQPIQFYSCFISYSTKDEAFAKRLHSKMREHNLRVWFANEDLKGGRKLHEQIDEAIRVYDKFIIVLSPESLRSKWVMKEVRRTRKAELANNQRKFFPIALMHYRELEEWECLDPETGTDLAAEIREYYVPDFRDWKNHDSFEKAFAQLLEGLKAVDAPPAPRIEPKDMPKDMPQNPQAFIGAKKRRLEKLEQQAAIYGIATPPEIANEIEDLRREIRELEGSRYRNYHIDIDTS
jgi:hypothetical protein